MADVGKPYASFPISADCSTLFGRRCLNKATRPLALGFRLRIWDVYVCSFFAALGYGASAFCRHLAAPILFKRYWSILYRILDFLFHPEDRSEGASLSPTSDTENGGSCHD